MSFYVVASVGVVVAVAGYYFYQKSHKAVEAEGDAAGQAQPSEEQNELAGVKPTDELAISEEPKLSEMSKPTAEDGPKEPSIFGDISERDTGSFHAGSFHAKKLEELGGFAPEELGVQGADEPSAKTAVGSEASAATEKAAISDAPMATAVLDNDATAVPPPISDSNEGLSSEALLAPSEKRVDESEGPVDASQAPANDPTLSAGEAHPDDAPVAVQGASTSDAQMSTAVLDDNVTAVPPPISDSNEVPSPASELAGVASHSNAPVDAAPVEKMPEELPSGGEAVPEVATDASKHAGASEPVVAAEPPIPPPINEQPPFNDVNMDPATASALKPRKKGLLSKLRKSKKSKRSKSKKSKGSKKKSKKKDKKSKKSKSKRDKKKKSKG